MKESSCFVEYMCSSMKVSAKQITCRASTKAIRHTSSAVRMGPPQQVRIHRREKEVFQPFDVLHSWLSEEKMKLKPVCHLKRQELNDYIAFSTLACSLHCHTKYHHLPTRLNFSSFAALLSFKSPLDYVFYLATINNIAAIFGFAGVLTSQRELVQVFFGWNAVQMVSFCAAKGCIKGDVGNSFYVSLL